MRNSSRSSKLDAEIYGEDRGVFVCVCMELISIT